MSTNATVTQPQTIKATVNSPDNIVRVKNVEAETISIRGALDVPKEVRVKEVQGGNLPTHNPNLTGTVNVNGDIVLTETSNIVYRGSEVDFDNLASLYKHSINTYFLEPTYNSTHSYRIDQYQVWEDSSKVTKLFTEIITYQDVYKPTRRELTDETNGNKLIEEIMWNGLNVVSITRSYT